MTLATKASISLAGKLASTVDLGSVAASIAKAYAVDLAHGTGAGQADRIWADTRTLAASANEELDLAGSLEDPLGGAFVLARVKGLIIAADAGNTNNVVVGAAASNAWATLLGATHTVTLRPGAVFAVLAGEEDATGYAVTAGTGDLLKVANSGSGTGVTYDIAVIGASA